MKAKTIFIIVITILATIILMKNTDEVIFWIFGYHSVPKLLVLAVFLVLGFIIGFLARGKRRTGEAYTITRPDDNPDQDNLDESDQEYIR